MRNLGVQVAVILSILFPHLASAADNAAATVNAQPVKQAWLDIVRQDAQEAGRKINDKTARLNLLRNELLSDEAIRLGIDKQPDFAAREEMKRRELLASLMVKDYHMKNPVSEDMLKAEYERVKTQRGNKEYSARHIELKTEDEARDVISQLAKGADFAKLAKEKSLDAASRDKGGLLDWRGKNAIKPPLGDALSKLQKGLFTTVPLQTRAGWHVLKLEGVRDLKMPAYDKIKEQMRQRLKTQQINKLIDSLRVAQRSNKP